MCYTRTLFSLTNGQLILCRFSCSISNQHLNTLITNFDAKFAVALRFQLHKKTKTLFDIFQIHIAVEDANDTPPEFDASSLRANPKENQAVNSIIHRVIARDSDRGLLG